MRTLALLFSALPLLGAVKVTVSPSSATVRGGEQQRFYSIVTGTLRTTVVWTVNGVAGGNATFGTIASDGTYTAPDIPTTSTVWVTATNNGVTAYGVVTLQNPVPVVTSVSPEIVPVGPFTLTVTGTGFVNGAQVHVAGKPVTATYISPTEIRATGTVAAQIGGLAAVTVTNPDPGSAVSNVKAIEVGPLSPKVGPEAAACFLTQASWGPNAASLYRVREIGYEAYLDEQFATPASTYPDYPDTNFIAPVQSRFFVNAVTGQDQLRQRVAFALSQILVVSGWEIGYSSQMTPYVRILHQDAFSNYRTLLRDVSLNPAMGRFLDMVYNEKAQPVLGTAPNENYARELAQLFTIGVKKLNQDGTPMLDGSGQPIPTYQQEDIVEFARALTGWTFPTKPGATPQVRNPAYFNGPMEASETLHDTGSKTLFDGAVLPAGQTASQDLDAVLDSLFRHPNTAPFVSRRLIQSLVKGHPSPAYVQRVANVFNNNGQGVRGDLKAVVKAILLDPEARAADYPNSPDGTDGHLMEPILYVIALARAVEAVPGASNNLAGLGYNMGQYLFFAPSVFNYFSPDFTIPNTTWNQPEFEIYTPSAAVARMNYAAQVAFSPQSASLAVDWTALAALAGDPESLLQAFNRVLLRGRLSESMKTSLLNSISILNTSYNKVRAQTMIHLIGSSAFYQVLQ